MSYRRNGKKRKGKRDRRDAAASAPSQSQQLDPALSARKAIKSVDKLRKDCVDAMRRICPDGWVYDETFARQLGNDSVGYYQSEAKVVVIEPEDAYDLFLHHNYAHNRRFDQAHSTKLSNAIKVGTSIDIGVGPGNFPSVVNGQHTLWAIYMRGQPTQVSLTIYQCRDDSAMASLFAIFDTPKIRTLAQSIEANKSSGSMDMTVSSTRHQRWTQSVAAAENDFNPPKVRETLAEKTARAQRPEVIAFSEWLEGMIENGNQAKMVQQGVGAAFYAMSISDKERAESFIRKYLTGIGVTDKHDPVGQIRNRMTINKPHAEHGSSACRMHAGLVFSAWRAYCLNKPLRLMKTTKDLPKANRWKIFASASNELHAVA